MSFPPAIPAAPTDEREEDYLAARTSHSDALIGLLPLVWPANRPDLRRRVVLAFGVLLIAKLVTVAVPVFYKDATDLLTAAAAKGGNLDIGTSVMLRNAAPAMAKVFVYASGENSRPSWASRVNTGRNDTVMISSEKNNAGPTS